MERKKKIKTSVHNIITLSYYCYYTYYVPCTNIINAPTKHTDVIIIYMYVCVYNMNIMIIPVIEKKKNKLQIIY